MSSPTAPLGEAPRSNQEPNETDIDADMEDVPQDETNTSQNTAGAANDRSSTIDNDTSNPTQADPTLPSSTQQQTQSSLPVPQSRKDVTLREFLSKMDDYAPIIPDAVTAHYLTLAGLPPPSANDPTGAKTGATPLPLARLLALATQKFVADVAGDAYQYSRIRMGGGGGGGPGVAGAAPGTAATGAGAAGAAGGPGKAGAQSTTLGVQRSGFGGGGTGGATGKTVLTMEDLGMAVQEYGVNVRRGEFYR